MPAVSTAQVQQAARNISLNVPKMSAGITAVAALKRELTGAVLVKSVLGLLAEIQRESPVRSGRFRGGWQPFLQAHGLPADISGPYVETRAVAEGFMLGDYEDRSQAPAGGQFVRITNGVPYGPELEAGKSDQAGSGFVAASLARHGKHLREAARTVRR